jgi:hypothetical protein
VEALREVATQLGKKDWNFSVDPCINDSSWATPKSNLMPLYNNSLICNCSIAAGVCHVAQLYVPFISLYINVTEVVNRSSFYSTKSRKVLDFFFVVQVKST